MHMKSATQKKTRTCNSPYLPDVLEPKLIGVNTNETPYRQNLEVYTVSNIWNEKNRDSGFTIIQKTLKHSI